jgi:hypothetical protein
MNRNKLRCLNKTKINEKVERQIKSNFWKEGDKPDEEIKYRNHNVLGHTNFWKKQQKKLQFFFSRCKLGCLIKRKTKGFKNIFIGRLFNSIKNERFWVFLINNIDFHTTTYN